MDALRFLQDLAVVLCTAAAALLLFKRFKQPPVLGYLAAGLILGPNTPGTFIADLRSLEALSEIGVVFLLFALGVEFNLRRLYAVGARALACAGVSVALLLAVGYNLGLLLGLEPVAGLLLGGVVSLASTAIVARTLLESGRRGGWEELVGGVLIAEDIAAVILLALFSSAAGLGSLQLSAVVSALARFGMLVTLVLVAGLLALPRVLAVVERSGLPEVRSLAVIGSCFAIALLTDKLGFSAGLGAFLAGAMLAESPSAGRLREVVEPFKDVFGAVFFVAVGMLVEPGWLLARWQLTLALAAVVCAARFAANFAALCAVGEESVPAAQAALARLPIGEFSFLLAQFGERRELSAVPLYPMAVALCLATTTLSAGLTPWALARPEAVHRCVPRWLERLLHEYRSVLRRLTVPRRARSVWGLVRPSVVQIVLNLLGISGVFLAANALQEASGLDARVPGAVWTATALFSLPFLLALWRKTQAVALILLEAVTVTAGEDRPPAESRPLFTRFLLGLATVAVAWWYLSLSLPLLPPWPWTLAPLAAMGVAGALFWRGMNRLYARLQVALRETLAAGEAEPEAAATAVAHLVEAPWAGRVHVVACRVERSWGCAGRTLGNLDLRAKTGASVLQVNRAGESLPAPGPQLHLHAGDEVLLIGEREQIRAAREFLERG